MRPDLNHIPEELLDEMALGRLSERDSEIWEEHLLVCASCQDRLAEADEYICVMKSAATEFARTSSRVPASFQASKPMMAALTHAAIFAVTFLLQ